MIFSADMGAGGIMALVVAMLCKGSMYFGGFRISGAGSGAGAAGTVNAAS